MSKSLFISAVHEDSHRIESIRKWAQNGQLGSVIITHETEDKRSLGKDEIKRHISNKIRGAAVVIVLIGQDTHNHNWIEAEVELANSFHIKIACMRLPNSTGGLPTILSKYPLLNFDPETLKKFLNTI